MPDDKRCEYLADWLDKLSEADVNFILWNLSSKYSDKLKHSIENNSMETKEDLLVVRSQQKIADGLDLLHEVLGYEW